MNLVTNIRNAIEAGNAVLGTKETLKEVMTGDVKLVVISSNCERSAREDLERYAGLGGTEVREYDGSSIELGEVCGVPYVVSMLSVLAEKKQAPKSKRKK